MAGFLTEELGTLLWTFANQTMYNEALFAAAAVHARGRLDDFNNFDFFAVPLVIGEGLVTR